MRKSKNSAKTKIQREDTLLSNKMSFDTVESYKALRTNLGFALHKSEGCKKLTITSSFAGEGKSTTSVNTAIGFAQTGAKVMIIDCDLRKPHTHTFFKLKNKLGLSNYIEGAASQEDIVLETTEPNLSLITAGSIPPNPSELLSSDRFVKLVDALTSKYDYIVFDTPPVNVVSDALSVAPHSDGVVIVVRQNITTHPELNAAVEAFEFAGIKILGFVFNSVDNNVSSVYHSRYYKHYGYKRYGKYGYYRRSYGYNKDHKKSESSK